MKKKLLFIVMIVMLTLCIGIILPILVSAYSLNGEVTAMPNSSNIISLTDNNYKNTSSDIVKATTETLDATAIADLANLSYNVSLIGEVTKVARPIRTLTDGVWNQSTGAFDIAFASTALIYDENGAKAENGKYFGLLTVNLGKTALVDAAGYFCTSANAFPQAADFYVSNDGVTFTKVLGYDATTERATNSGNTSDNIGTPPENDKSDNSKPASYSKLFDFGGVETKYIRIGLIKDAGDSKAPYYKNNGAIALREFAIYTESAGTYGDINGDKIIDIRDAMMLYELTSKDSTQLFDAKTKLRSDLNRDGNCDAADMERLIGYLDGSVSSLNDAIRVSCVGDSITYGNLATNKSFNYPSQLAKLLGNDYAVSNYGKGGTTMFGAHGGKNDRAYTDKTEYSSSLNSSPDIVIIMLGANDCNGTIGMAAASGGYLTDEDLKLYKADAVALINSYKKLPTNPKIYLCLTTAMYRTVGDKFSEQYISNFTANLAKIRPLQREIAAECGVTLIDTFTEMDKAEYYADGLHPNDTGYAALAKIIADAVSVR